MKYGVSRMRFLGGALSLLATIYVGIVENGIAVEAFTISSRSRAVVPAKTLVPTALRHPSSLLAQESKNEVSPSLFKKSSRKLTVGKFMARWRMRLRRAMAVFLTAALLWFGGAGLQTPPSHASTAHATEALSRFLPSKLFSAPLDKMVDRYVQKHMFNDDTYDPVESLYREAYEDTTTGSHPRAISEITSSVLGQDGIKKDDEGSGIGNLLTTGIGFLQKKGLSESTAIFVLAALFVIAGPCAFLFGGMVIGGMSKRQMNKVMKQRYGDTYTLDATIKKEEEVEAPPDDDDEDDDDEDGDDEDGDDKK